MEFTLLAAVLTGLAAMWGSVWLLHRGGTNLGDHPVDRMVTAAVAGMLAGRLAAMVMSGTNPLLHPADVLVVRAGVDTGVASLAAVATLAWLTRERLPSSLDVLAPAALAGLGGWHAGCLWRGTCLGTVSDLPWAWTQPGSDITRHPVGLYAAAGMLVAGLVVSRLPSRPWLRAGTAVAMAAVVRLAVEPLRPSLGGGPVWWYVAGIAAGISAPLVMPRLVRRRAARQTSTA